MTYTCTASSTCFYYDQSRLHVLEGQVLMYRMPLSPRFRQPHPSKRNKKLGQTYCPKSSRCRATKHGLTPGSKQQHCKLRMRAEAYAGAGAEDPARVAQHSQKGRTIRYATTSLVHTSKQAAASSTAQRTIQPFADFRSLPWCIYHLTSGTFASR